MSGCLGHRGVVALVLAEVVLADEALATHRAGEGPHARVCSVVVDELGALCEALLTLGAGEGPLTSVQHAVADEVCRACEAAATLPAPQGAAVPCAAPTSTATAAASSSGGGGPSARPVGQSTAALMRTQAHLQLEALSARGTGEGPASGRCCRVLLLPRFVAKAFGPARVFAGIVEGSWGLAGV